MIIILLLAALLSIIASRGEDGIDAIIILFVVLLNAAFGVYQEGKAEQAIKALKKMASTKAKVKSENQIIEIESTHLVPGDIVILEDGAIVPAPNVFFRSFIISMLLNSFIIYILPQHK